MYLRLFYRNNGNGIGSGNHNGSKSIAHHAWTQTLDFQRKCQHSTAHAGKAIEIPLEAAELSLSVLDIANELVKKGNPNSVSDVGVAGEVALAGVRGACMNVLK